MIKTIQIRDFQSISSLNLDLGNFTIIMGRSDIGKSAVIRAVRSLVENRGGSAFIRYGAKQAGVSLKLDPGEGIAWLKSGSATYKWYDGSQVQEFTKTGRSLPAEIADTLKLSGIDVGSEHVMPNFSGQFDPPFLVTETASTRARWLGELCGINIIYLAVQEGRRRLQSSQKLQSTRISDLEAVNQSLLAYTDLADQKTSLESVGLLLEQIKTLELEISKLSADIESLQQAEAQEAARLESAQQLEICEHSLPAAGILLRDCGKLRADLTKLNELTREVWSLNAQVRDTSLEINRTKLKLTEFSQCPTCGRYYD